MSSSDDESEAPPEFVSQYYFEDDEKSPVSFAVLPISLDSTPTVESPAKAIYVRGTTDAGLHKLYKPVIAWKFDISGKEPVISVLSKDNNWIKLQKPRNSYEEFIRTVLIAVHFLHLVRRNPDSRKGVWDKLSSIFRLHEQRPTPRDLIDQKGLIEKALEHDEVLKNSNYLKSILEKNSLKKNKTNEDVVTKRKSDFIVNDDEPTIDDHDEEGSADEEDGSNNNEDDSGDGESGSEDEDEPFDSVCCICDNGGNLLICDGSCMRSFHATRRAAKDAESGCLSLGLSEKEVEDMATYICPNCQFKRHQCYSCGKLGSSDKHSGAEVFQCVNATCGYYYHPHCVSKQLHPGNDAAAVELQKKIVAGESFTCPLHMCFVCKQPEVKKDPELRMAVCRRCPKAYHKKCMPRKIAFDDEIEDEDSPARAWEGLLVDRILIYCLRHAIVKDLGTPSRDHIKFPNDHKVQRRSNSLALENKAVPTRKRPPVRISQAGVDFESARKGSLLDTTGTKFSKLKGTDSPRNLSAEKKFASSKSEGQTFTQSELVKSSKIGKLVEPKSTTTITAAAYSLPAVDSGSATRILHLMNEVSSMISLDDIIGKHETLISSRAYKRKMDPCKTITLGKVEASCKAVRAASSKLDGGGSIEEAKAICEPNILNQISKWKGKLKVYLAPFIYGMRYTSFGRHFTKVEKLSEIVDKLHWYVNSNDTIVDFCCGANDFSRLMKERLESTGKSCHYKNYDMFRPKNDFDFEERDWMTVQPNELPTGSQLIMGLNPPFGVKACYANQFINKALEFKPKLLILIVPQETERLDKKKSPYDLVWEDRDKLSGRSFYLPGSVDINDKQMEDWNVVAPVLYLWSRPDWTARHSAIAKKHGHLHGGEKETNEMNRSTHDPTLKKIEHTPVTKAIDVSPFADEPKGPIEIAASGKVDADKLSARNGPGGEKQTRVALRKNKTNKNSKKKRLADDVHAREAIESSHEYKRSRSSPLNPHHEWTRCSPVNSRCDRVSPPLSLERSPAGLEIRDLGHDQFEPSSFREKMFPLEKESFGSNGEIRENALVHHEATSYMGTSYRRGGAGISGGHYDDLTGSHNPSSEMFDGGRERWPVDASLSRDYASRVSPTFPEYPPRVTGEWPDYMQGSEVYGVNHPFSTSEQQRFRTPAYRPEPSYNRMAPMSAMDKYNPRLDEMNHPRMNAFNPDMGRPAGISLYNHQAPRPGYSGVPSGFAPGPPGPPPPPHHGSFGGWISD